MKDFSPRQFLKSLGLVIALLIAVQTGVLLAQNTEKFEMLVVGDSIVWGQGLEEKNKFYTLVKDWLQIELGKNVNLKVKAHSGARLNLQENESKALKKAEKDESASYPGEINLWFPSLTSQLETAQKEYPDLNDVKLILLSGSITDIDTAEIINPFGNNKKLRAYITRYCEEDMFRFLEKAARIFPHSRVVVIGYFPILSKDTSSGKLLNALLESFNFPRPLKFLANNFLTGQIFKILRNKALRRSQIWFEDSNRALASAVNRINEKLGAPRAVFVKAPFSEANAFETKNTLLFKMEKKGKVNDELYQQRLMECSQVLSELKKLGWKQSLRRCELAAVGHPNVAGAKAYAESIKESLKPWLNSIVPAGLK